MLQAGYIAKPITFSFLKEYTTEISCRSCGEKVSVKMAPWADGHIADCPKCGKIAYLGD